MKVRCSSWMVVSVVVLLLISLAGCGGSGGEVEATDASRDITGVVRSVKTYEPIASAQVHIGDETVATDAQGGFSFNMVIDDTDIIQITKEGYVPYQQSLQEYSGDTIVFESFLMPVDVVQVIDPAAAGGNTITNRDGASVTIPQLPGIGENLVVSLTYFNVSTDDLLAVPGDFSAEDENQDATNLISHGIIDVGVKGETSGDDYSLDGLAAYEIRIPISGDIANAPTSIPLWYFDEDRNLWVEQGSATQDGDAYVGTVTHFSLWNTDLKFYDTTCVIGKISDPFAPSNEVYLMKLSVDGYLRYHTQTDLDFEIIRLPVNKTAMLEVKKVSTGEVWIKHFDTPPTASSACLDIGEIPGLNWVAGVGGIKITNNNGVITISWDYEPIDPGFDHVIIVYNRDASIPFSSASLFGPMATSGTITVPRGIKSQEVVDLEDGVYTFSVKAVYVDERESIAATKKVRVYDQTVTSYSNLVLEDNDVYCGIAVEVSYDDYNEAYAEPLDIPNGTPITLTATPGSALWQYDSGALEVLAESHSEFSFITENDVTISFVCDVQ